MLGLRARGKARRRDDVIAAAASLWREHGLDHVGLAEVAVAAEVSIQTVYNLIGGIDALKVAIIEGLLDRLAQTVSNMSEVGVSRSLLQAKTSACLFMSDPALYKSLLVDIPRALFTGTHLSRVGSSFQRDALLEARRSGEIAIDIDIEALAWQIHLQFTGCLMAWACGTLDDTGFERAAELAVLAPLAACAVPDVRAELNDRVRQLLTVSDAERSARYEA